MHAWVTTLGKVGLGAVCAFMCLATTAGNGLILYAMKRKPALQTPSNLFIASLSTADLIIGVFVLPLASIQLLHKWSLGPTLCTAWLCLDYIASSCSILSLMSLAIDRYFSIISPLKYRNIRTNKLFTSIIVFMWLCCFLYVLPIVFWHLWFPQDIQSRPIGSIYNRTVISNEIFPNSTIFTFPRTTSEVCEPPFSNNLTFKLVSLVYSFLIPHFTLIAVYIRIFIEIHRRTKKDILRKTGHLQSLRSDTCASLEHEKESEVDNNQVNESPNRRPRPELVATSSSASASNVANSSLEIPKAAPKLCRKLSINNIYQSVYRSTGVERQREIRAAKKLAFIMLAFTICWVPYMVVYIIVAIWDEAATQEPLITIFQLATFLGYLNSMINPILYPLCIENFRKELNAIVLGKLSRRFSTRSAAAAAHNHRGRPTTAV